MHAPVGSSSVRLCLAWRTLVESLVYGQLRVPDRPIRSTYMIIPCLTLTRGVRGGGGGAGEHSLDLKSSRATTPSTTSLSLQGSRAPSHAPSAWPRSGRRGLWGFLGLGRGLVPGPPQSSDWLPVAPLCSPNSLGKECSWSLRRGYGVRHGARARAVPTLCRK